jgi:glycerophosphoryl diester phosphodiesterase
MTGIHSVASASRRALAVSVLLTAFATLPSSGATGAQSGRLHVLDIRSVADLRAYFHYEKDGPPLVTSHRGGPRAGFPENAIATFENTLRHTWSNLEVDPRLTRDGAIVLFHDPTLERTSTGSGRVIDHTLAELRQLRLKDPAGNVTEHGIPTLDEALAWAKGRAVLFLDDKDVDVVERTRAIQRNDAHAWAVVMAYNLEDARRIHQFDSEVLIQVFLADSQAVARFDATGIPWRNIVGFVTHAQPKEPEIFALIGSRGAMGVLGTSRTIDRAYANGEIDRMQLLARYRDAIASGAHIVETDLGVEAGEALEPLRARAAAKQQFFSWR